MGSKAEKVEKQILNMLKSGPKSCSEIGEFLWGDGTRTSQSYARPAGKALKPLKEEGLVKHYLDDRRRWMYRLTDQREGLEK